MKYKQGASNGLPNGCMNCRADFGRGNRQTFNPAQHADTFCQVDQHHNIGLSRRAWMNVGNRIHLSAASRLHPFQRPSLPIGQMWRKALRAVGWAALQADMVMMADLSPAGRQPLPASPPSALAKHLGYLRASWPPRPDCWQPPMRACPSAPWMRCLSVCPMIPSPAYRWRNIAACSRVLPIQTAQADRPLSAISSRHR